MSVPKIRVQNLSKVYKQYSSFYKRALSWLGVDFSPSKEVSVLKDISFDVAQGEAVALIGQNGAGKSTLLKLITGTSLPNQGKIEVNGSISSILELGMGFNPELTGRDNVMHLCSMSGFHPQEIQDLLPQIHEFSELGEYFDRPIKIYSSGMQARLAFSAATATRPDVLIVDEALSVGDSYFQHKSFGRMKEFLSQGTTLLFVSHDMSAVKSLCDRAILLDQGLLIKDGSPEEVADHYNALISKKEGHKIHLKRHSSGKMQTVSGTGEASVHEIYLLDDEGKFLNVVNVGQCVDLIVKVHVKVAIPKLVLGYIIKDRLGQAVFGTNTFHTDQIVEDVKAGSMITFKIEFSANLGPGSYSVSTALVGSDTHLENNYEWKDLALVFEVNNLNKMIFTGNTWIPPQITLEAS